MTKTGRPSKRTPEAEQAVEKAIRAGFGMKTAAHFARVHPSTLQRWMEEDDSFRERVYWARADAKIALGDALHQAGIQGNARAAYQWLAARCPEFREKKTVNVTSPSEAARALREAAAAMEDSVSGPDEEAG